MNIRIELLQQNPENYKAMKKYNDEIYFHWFFGDEPQSIRRREAIQDRRDIANGKKIDDEILEHLYDEEKFEKDVKNCNTKGQRNYIIYEGTRAIGYLKCRMECGALRIVEFPLDFAYQAPLVVKQTIKCLYDRPENKKICSQNKLVILKVQNFAKQLLKESAQYVEILM